MKCPRCGKETEGSYSEGGIRWALCEDCMNDDKEKFNGDYERCLKQGRRYMETGNIDEFKYQRRRYEPTEISGDSSPG